MGSNSNSLIRLTSESELEALHVETAINTSSKITKVTDQSVLRSLIRGNVRTAKKALKDIALSISHLFPDSAYGSALDDVADDHGIAPRFAAAQSSTYVRLVATPGTTYTQGVNTVSDNKGNIFDLSNTITIGVKGYDYVKVRSQQSGASTNVDPYTIININPAPSGHVGVLNEYAAIGGRDSEDDDTFRQRIKEGPDILARGTLSYLTQAFMKINPNVLRVIYEGTNSSGKVVLGVLTVNGIDLTANELLTLTQQGADYFSLTEMAPIGTTSFGLTLKNVDYFYIDATMRLGLFSGASYDAVIKDIQQKWSKLVDFRTWGPNDKISWLDLILAVKNNQSVKSVPDTYFFPNIDIFPSPGLFPRFRGFIVYDLDGVLQINQTSTVNPLFYSNAPDVDFASSVL